MNGPPFTEGKAGGVSGFGRRQARAGETGGGSSTGGDSALLCSRRIGNSSAEILKWDDVKNKSKAQIQIRVKTPKS